MIFLTNKTPEYFVMTNIGYNFVNAKRDEDYTTNGKE